MHELDAGLIQIGIALGLRDRDFVEINSSHLRGAGGYLGIDGKSSGVTTKIEHSRVPGETGKCLAVFALVAEKSRFMAFGKIHFVTDAMLSDFYFIRCRGICFVEGGWLDPFQTAQIVIDMHPGKLGSGQLVQQGQPLGQSVRHTQRIYFAK